jgi:type IX secretion system PorP/SprF family membrane protein
MKTTILLALSFLTTSLGFSQQLPQLTLHMQDNVALNPGATGASEYTHIALQHRSQWVGFENAPSTQLLSCNSKLNGNMGLGGWLMNDLTGPTRRLSANFSYAYHITTGKFQLGLGVAASIMQYGIDGTKITLHQSNDLSVNEGVSARAVKPDASFGAYLYNDRFYAGLSVLQLFGSKVRIREDDLLGIVDLTQHFIISTGYRIELNEDIDIEPSFRFAGTFGSPVQLDFRATAWWQKKVMGGLSFRAGDAGSIMIGVRIRNMFQLMYSYDLVFSRLRKHNSGSHEIVLSFDLMKSQETKTIAPAE